MLNLAKKLLNGTSTSSSDASNTNDSPPAPSTKDVLQKMEDMRVSENATAAVPAGGEAVKVPNGSELSDITMV